MFTGLVFAASAPQPGVGDPLPALLLDRGDDERQDGIPLLRQRLELTLPSPDQCLGQIGLSRGHPGPQHQPRRHEQRRARGANASSHFGH